MLIFLAAAGAHAQWTQTRGPQGANFTAIAGNGTTILGSANGTVVRYDGSSWTRAGDLAAGRLFFVGDVVLGLKARNDGLWDIYRSTNTGSSWSATDRFGDVAVEGSVIYLAQGDILYRSDDGAISWSRVALMPAMTQVPVLHDGKLFAFSGFMSETLNRSTDGGVTWRAVESDLQVGGGGRFLVSAGEALYAVVNGFGIYRSVDDGSTWTDIGAGLPENALPAWLLSDGADLWTGSYDKLYRLAGAAVALPANARWETIDLPATLNNPSPTKDGLLVPTSIGAYRIDRGSTEAVSLNDGLYASSIMAVGAVGKAVLGSTYQGVYRSTDRGDTWEKTLDAAAQEFTTEGGRIWAIGGGLSRSLNDGATWEPMEPKFDEFNRAFTAVASDGGSVYVTVGSSFGEHGDFNWTSGGVFRSEDGGDSWTEVSAGLPHDFVTTVPVHDVAATERVVIIATLEGMYRSTNKGGTWIPAMNGIQTTRQNRGLGTFFMLNGKIYVQMMEQIYLAVDDGARWVPAPAAPSEYSISWQGSEVDGRYYTQGYRWMGGDLFEYRLFAFDGIGWADSTSMMPEGMVLGPFVRSGDDIYGGSIGHAIWRRYSPDPGNVSAVEAGRVRPAVIDLW